MADSCGLNNHVTSTRTGGVVAKFGIKQDAKDYAVMLGKREGPNGVIYEVIDARTNRPVE